MINKKKYICSKCGASGIKLWRESYVFADAVELKCAACLGVWSADNKGKSLNLRGILCDQIGWWIPAIAVPQEFQTYWEYISVLQENRNKWYALPTYL